MPLYLSLKFDFPTYLVNERHSFMWRQKLISRINYMLPRILMKQKHDIELETGVDSICKLKPYPNSCAWQQVVQVVQWVWPFLWLFYLNDWNLYIHVYIEREIRITWIVHLCLLFYCSLAKLLFIIKFKQFWPEQELINLTQKRGSCKLIQQLLGCIGYWTVIDFDI